MGQPRGFEFFSPLIHSILRFLSFYKILGCDFNRRHRLARDFHAAGRKVISIDDSSVRQARAQRHGENAHAYAVLQAIVQSGAQEAAHVLLNFAIQWPQQPRLLIIACASIAVELSLVLEQHPVAADNCSLVEGIRCF